MPPESAAATATSCVRYFCQAHLSGFFWNRRSLFCCVRQRQRRNGPVAAGPHPHRPAVEAGHTSKRRGRHASVLKGEGGGYSYFPRPPPRRPFTKNGRCGASSAVLLSTRPGGGRRVHGRLEVKGRQRARTGLFPGTGDGGPMGAFSPDPHRQNDPWRRSSLRPFEHGQILAPAAIYADSFLVFHPDLVTNDFNGIQKRDFDRLF